LSQTHTSGDTKNRAKSPRSFTFLAAYDYFLRATEAGAAALAIELVRSPIETAAAGGARDPMAPATSVA